MRDTTRERERTALMARILLSFPDSDITDGKREERERERERERARGVRGRKGDLLFFSAAAQSI